MMKRAFVTGAAGFIGSNLVDRLLDDGIEVVGWDNFSTGQRQFIQTALKNPRYCLVEGDNLYLPGLTKAMEGCDFVFHLAANADVRFGTEHPQKDLEQNTIATFNVLEAMRANQIRKIAFSSTGSIYGEARQIPTPETAEFPIQTSLYGASKLAGEGMISAYCEGYGFEGTIFRFVSILGERYTHGHVFDFHKQLLADPTRLQVLGDGTQKKSYLHIQDCVDAVLQLARLSTPNEKLRIYNLGAPEYCQVRDSIGWICKELGVDPRLEFSGGERGWIGDNPFIFLDCTKAYSTGWKPKYSIQESVVSTLRWLKANPWIYEARK